MLTVTFNGVVEVVSLSETIPVSWSPHGDLCFSFGTHLVVGPIASPVGEYVKQHLFLFY